MIATRIIPCLDVRDGRVVKGVRFAGLRDLGDPAERAAAYEAQGADEIVMLDVSATPQQRRTAIETVKHLRSALSIPLTVGGGVRSIDDAAALLDAGADKVSVNTAAVLDPSLLRALAERFGRQCVVIAIDARRDESAGRWRVIVRSGSSATDLDAIDWAARAADLGAGEVLLTSFDRDGTREGYDLDVLRAVCGAIDVPVIASGGASSVQHMLDAIRAGASAVLAASIFHENSMTISDVKRALAAAGAQVRPV
jgi:imidazoleglycerol phosphate synthase cyclase subunit